MSAISRSRRGAWAFPDATIDATQNIMDNAWYSLRPIWYELNSSGVLVLRNSATYGAKFFYTAANAKLVRQNSTEAYVNVSCGDPAYMDALCSNATKRTNAINTLKQFCIDNDFQGVDLDFEGYGSWTAAQYANYKTFVTELGNALHYAGLLLSIEAPAIWNNSTSSSSNEWTSRNSQGYYLFKYEDFDTLPVDRIVIMAYDYYYDMGSGTPHQPLAWLADILRWAKLKITDKKKIVAGLPAFGYFGATGGYAITQASYEVMKAKPGFASAQRDAASGELIWVSGANSYALVDDEALDKKTTVCEEYGIYETVLWYVGNNQYGSDKLQDLTPKA